MALLVGGPQFDINRPARALTAQLYLSMLRQDSTNVGESLSGCPRAGHNTPSDAAFCP